MPQGPAAGSAIPAKRALPSKESTLFKDLLSHYESRQLKKGHKIADQILKKFPEHGETLCMKGLVLTHMGKREEGLELVKKGIRLDLTSHICWHVFGLIQKGEKNYDEALKSYTQALRFDKENLNLLQDAANLQTQLRLFDSLQETRHTILRLRPNVRRNWVALAVAYHLGGNLEDARNVLEQYARTLKNIPDYDTEHSEVILYHIRLLADLGHNADALALLDTSAKSRAVVDRMSIMEYRARLLSSTGAQDDAAHAWRALIEHNPDNYAYYRGYLSAKGFDIDNLPEVKTPEVLKILSELGEQMPKAAAPRRLALDVASGTEFTTLARTYILSALRRGIPSLFADIKALYTDPAKRDAIERVVTAFYDSLSNSASASTPATHLWTLYFLAQHHSFSPSPPSPPSPPYTHALTLIHTALAHTPTLPELHTLHARILKRAGDPYGACAALEEARRLDGQDRYVNTKSAKYHLRCGMLEEAEGVLGVFTKKDAASPGADLEDMQSLLYMLEEASAQNRLNRPGLALKRYLAIQKVFDDIYNDQYDFHSYSIRRFTINIYLNLMSFEDKLRAHPAYVASSVEASRIYVRVHDDPSVATASTSIANMTGVAKKAIKKAKKAAFKAQEEPKKGLTQATSNEDKGLEPGPAKDEDPEGIKALGVKDPIEQAWKLLKPFATPTQNSLDVWIAVYDVSVRRQKYLLAAKALLKARGLKGEDGELHIRIVDFKQRVSSLPQLPADPIGPALASALALILPDELALETYNSQYLQRHASSAASVLAAAKVAHNLHAPIEEVEDLLFRLTTPEVNDDIKSGLATHAFLVKLGSRRADEFRQGCDDRYVLSTVFKTPEEIARLRAPPAQGMSDGDEPPEGQ
ncbi:N-terminal acetyltransferase A auxiliary subunit [Rickenella mellea]|uniref:N-terminal acetyltransferase A auxiliary subunit n=1 Tax=Rickenella mellea TaxID=50990 RepID=A0A4Y7PX78_9AGAM|nr:N-terminal acetyltransferase A auxiliary subunit [Rickenella mellea]